MCTSTVWMLRVDRSDGKGLGVFASRDIARGQVVSTYPKIPANDDDMRGEYVLFLKGVRWTGRPWTGEVPCIVDTEMPVAHLFNDAAVLRKRELWPGLDQWTDDTQEYENTRSQCNVMNDDDGVFTATRDIAKDEEILFYYGALYWSHVTYAQEVYDLLCITIEAPSVYGDGTMPANLDPHGRMRLSLSLALYQPYFLRGMPRIPSYVDLLGSIGEFATKPATAETTTTFRHLWRLYTQLNDQVLSKIPIASHERLVSIGDAILGRSNRR